MKTLQSIIFLLFSTGLMSQVTIEFKNPSFEDIPRCCNPPIEWTACGDKDLNSPDIQPGLFAVNLKPINGESYISLVTRDNNSWESVSQILDIPVQKSKKYSFTIFLAKSPELISKSRLTVENVNYTKPIKLRIWGSNKMCSKIELLAESPLIDHEEWKEYKFLFEPQKKYKIITFEAFYETPFLDPYNGHILLDNCSEINEITQD